MRIVLILLILFFKCKTIIRFESTLNYILLKLKFFLESILKLNSVNL